MTWILDDFFLYRKLNILIPFCPQQISNPHLFHISISFAWFYFLLFCFIGLFNYCGHYHYSFFKSIFIIIIVLSQILIIGKSSSTFSKWFCLFETSFRMSMSNSLIHFVYIVLLELTVFLVMASMERIDIFLCWILSPRIWYISSFSQAFLCSFYHFLNNFSPKRACHSSFSDLFMVLVVFVTTLNYILCIYTFPILYLNKVWGSFNFGLQTCKRDIGYVRYQISSLFSLAPFSGVERLVQHNFSH